MSSLNNVFNVSKINKRTRLSYGQKLKLIAKIKILKNKGWTHEQIAQNEKVSQQQIDKLARPDAEKELNLKSKLSSSKSKGVMVHRKFESLETKLYAWFLDKRQKKIPLNGELMKRKAKIMADNLKCTDFKASGNWLKYFNKRFGLSFKKSAGESDVVDLDVVNDWLFTEWPRISQTYPKKKIWNLDETPFFYQAVPLHTYHFMGQPLNDRKTNKS